MSAPEPGDVEKAGMGTCVGYEHPHSKMGVCNDWKPGATREKPHHPDCHKVPEPSGERCGCRIDCGCGQSDHSDSEPSGEPEPTKEPR